MGLADHNEMHEARKNLDSPALKTRYLIFLRKILHRRLSAVSDYDLLNAEAKEHQEAYRKTIAP